MDFKTRDTHIGFSIIENSKQNIDTYNGYSITDKALVANIMTATDSTSRKATFHPAPNFCLKMLILTYFAQ